MSILQIGLTPRIQSISRGMLLRSMNSQDYCVQIQLQQNSHQQQMDNKKSNRKIKYATISLTRRRMLISQVLEKGKSINSSAKKFGIKCSTAKIIVRRFRKTGTIYVRNKSQGIQIYGINDLSLSLQEKMKETKRQERAPEPVAEEEATKAACESFGGYYVPAQLDYSFDMSLNQMLGMQPVYFFWE